MRCAAVAVLVAISALSLALGCGPRPISSRAAPTDQGYVSLEVASRASGSEGLYWELWGPPPTSGRTAFLVFHGGPGAPEEGLGHQTFWRLMARQLPVLYFDQYGSGRSGNLGTELPLPDEQAKLSLAAAADDGERVRAAIAGPDTPVVVFGMSAGAQLALLYALRHPEHVRGLVLVEPAADHRWVSQQRDHLAAFVRSLMADDRLAADTVEELLAGRRPCDEWTSTSFLFTVVGGSAYTYAAQQRLRKALREAGAGSFDSLCALGPSPARPSLLEESRLRSPALYRVLACQELGWAHVSAKNCEGVAEGRLLDLSPQLGAITAPTLILSSAHDPIVPAELHDAVWAAMGGDARLVRFRRSGHLPLQEEPSRSARAVLDFLDEMGIELRDGRSAPPTPGRRELRAP